MHQRWLPYVTCPQPVAWQGDGGELGVHLVLCKAGFWCFHFMWWKADAISSAILVQAVYCAVAEPAVPESFLECF